MSSKNLKVYLSGAITGTEGYEERFDKAEKYFREKGFDVINPCRVNKQLPDSTTHSEYMEMSLVMIKMADGIALFPDWENSKGANMEKTYAETLNKVVWKIPQTIFGRM